MIKRNRLRYNMQRNHLKWIWSLYFPMLPCLTIFFKSAANVNLSLEFTGTTKANITKNCRTLWGKAYCDIRMYPNVIVNLYLSYYFVILRINCNYLVIVPLPLRWNFQFFLHQNHWHARLRVQILSFRHTEFLKRNHLGSRCLPPIRSTPSPPYGKSGIRHLK